MSDTTRIAIYAIFTAVLGFMSGQGWVTADEATAYAAAAGETLGAAALLMAAVKTFKQRGRDGEVDNSQR